jgi:nitrogen-specific signal transduction histidine kinase
VLHLQTSAEGPFKPVMAELRFFSPWPDAQARISPVRLFEPFASGRPGGLGLGLYQARKSLQEAGGDLSAEVDAFGITFFLTIPQGQMTVAGAAN